MSAPSTSTNDTGLFGFHATWLGKASDAFSASLLQEFVVVHDKDIAPTIRLRLLRQCLQAFALPEPITAYSSVKQSENYKDAWVVFFSRSSKNGLWITLNDEIDGVWSLTGGEYSWHTAQGVDIAASVEAGNQLKLSALK